MFDLQALLNLIVSLDNQEFWWLIVFSGLSSLLCFGLAFYQLHKKRVIEDTPTSWMRSAAQGYVELIGRGIQMEGMPTTSPLSGKPCLWYHTKVEKLEKGNEFPLTWKWPFLNWGVYNESVSDELFYIDDDTGKCAIDPDGATITPTLTRSWHGNTPTPDRGPALGKSGLFGISGYSYRYTEKLITTGDILYVLGDLKTHGSAGSEMDIQVEVRDLLAEWKQDNTALLDQFDQNNDGVIDMAEWKKVREVAQQEVADKYANNESPPSISVISDPEDNRKPYLISSQPMHHLIQRYHWFACGFLVAAFSLGGLWLWAVNLRITYTV